MDSLIQVGTYIHLFIIVHIALAKQGDNTLRSVHLFVCLFVCSARGITLMFGVENNPYQFKDAPKNTFFLSIHVNLLTR